MISLNNEFSNINQLLNNSVYEPTNNIYSTRGSNVSKLKAGLITNSVINKLHLIKLSGLSALDNNIKLNPEYKKLTFSDLCELDIGAIHYDVDDFLYAKNLGQPLNKLITLRRFPYPCTDNIFDKGDPKGRNGIQGEPDIARLITFSNQEVNKLDEILSFNYGMEWKQLTAEMEEMSMVGTDQSGLQGFLQKALKVFDPELIKNQVRGGKEGPLANYNPKHDANKVYGPVDSIHKTHIRDVGLNFEKDLDLTFEYELRSYNGRTPEYAMRDVISNILACTFNNAKFWTGSRYWVGDRPSQYLDKLRYLNSDEANNIVATAKEQMQTVLKSYGSETSALGALKGLASQAFKNGAALGVAKLMDTVGRPGIITMNSLLSGEPTGYWHVMVGNPLNPIICMGNLILQSVDFNFPTDSLSYGDFPTKLQVKVKLKPGQPKDRAGIETMFNAGKQRIYYAPNTVKAVKTNKTNKNARQFFKFEKTEVDEMLAQAYDFLDEKTPVTSVFETTKNNTNNTNTTGNNTNPTSHNQETMSKNSDL